MITTEWITIFDDREERSAKQVLADLTAAFNAIPEECRDKAIIAIGYGMCDEKNVFLRYDRRLTEEERIAQQKEIDACTRRTEAKEREELARLKAKYEGS